ncbi:MAG: hypothetical protein V2A54_14315 [Bacteroidota bacterium]
MKKSIMIMAIALTAIAVSCKHVDKDYGKKKGISIIPEDSVNQVRDQLLAKYGDKQKVRIERGVIQAASFWTKKDGTVSEFKKFCIENFIAKDTELEKLFLRLQDNFEILFGHYNKMGLALKQPVHLEIGEMLPIDELFAGYNPGAHMNDDFFQNKIAFQVLLNFPAYTLEEKDKLGAKWTSKQWAYARMGDMFISREPADLILKISDAIMTADNYIANYKFYMGHLLNEKGDTLFPKNKCLTTHWGLRDELKSHYNDQDRGLEKQRMIYEVMKRIISQELPENVINSDKYTWKPISNKLYENKKEITFKSEPDTRYDYLLKNFQLLKEEDPYYPNYDTYIKRKFDLEMEISQQEVEKIFIHLLSSPQVKSVAGLIQKRLGRPLETFDIWYDGFKSRSTVKEDDLSAQTRKLYPTPAALEKELPVILEKLGFTKEDANTIASHIQVDPSRGPGHAWEASMKSDKAHLRTRVEKDGMDYKGYCIAVHEFGHNVEQTVSLHNVDYYMLKGVPNTAFTEALAFIFQAKDLELLGVKNDDPNKKYFSTLDNFWSAYEIMGVSLVDMYVWKWLYENPKATEKQLKETVITKAKEVWNKYYAPVFGIKDQPILGIYSHMIDAPLYLSAYPIGHLIEFQLGKYLEGKPFAAEVVRIFKAGRLTPRAWMLNAVGSPLSADPLIQAAGDALTKIEQGNALVKVQNEKKK